MRSGGQLSVANRKGLREILRLPESVPHLPGKQAREIFMKEPE